MRVDISLAWLITCVGIAKKVVASQVVLPGILIMYQGFAVQQFDLRSTAIASLSAAFLSKENRIDDEIEGIWSVCTQLLYGLLGILGGIANKNEV